MSSLLIKHCSDLWLTAVNLCCPLSSIMLFACMTVNLATMSLVVYPVYCNVGFSLNKVY